MKWKEIFETIRDAIVAPKTFFKSHKKEEKPKRLVVYLLAITLVGFLLNVVGVILIQPIFNQIYAQFVPSEVMPPAFNPSLIIPSLIQSLIGAVISAGIVTFILHFWLKLFTKRGNWKQVLKVYVYSQTPIAIFGWLPILSLVGLIESIYLLILGIEDSHELDRKTAILVIVLPAIFLFILSILLSIFFFSSIPNSQG